MYRSAKIGSFLLILAGVLLSPRLLAGDLFILSANDVAPLAPPTVRATGSDLGQLVDNAINTKAAFQSLSTTGPLYANLTYSGVPNALQFGLTPPAAGAVGALWTGQLSGLGGLNKTFTAPTRQGVYDQIEAFLKKEGSTAYANFLKAISSTTKTSPLDGSPASGTATRSFQNFADYSSTISQTKEEKQAPKQAEGRVGFGLVGDVGVFQANGVKGTAYSLPLFMRFRLTERVGLNFSLPLSYAKIEKATIFGAGLNIGLPIKLIASRPDNPWSWQVTPFGGGNVSGSKELLVGGIINDAGLGSVLTYDFGAVALSLGNQFSMYESYAVDFADVKVDPGVSQQIVKNGLKLGVPLGQRWVFDLYGIHTKFLQAAGVDQYYTFGTEIGYRLLGKPDAPKKRNGYIKLGLYSDVGSGYSSQHIQFGSGWKF